MATPTRGYRPLRVLVSMGTAALVAFGLIFVGATWSDATWAPKLALDLEGGTQIILTPVAESDEAVTPEVISQAIAIIRQRVDASGVSETEITSQGGGNIVVGLPGTPDEATLDLVRTPAVMDFRPVLRMDYGVPGDEEAGVEGLPTDAELDTEGLGLSDFGWITQEVQRDFNTIDCTDPTTMLEREPAPSDRAMVTCDANGLFKYILGPVEIPGTHISSASSGLQPTQFGGTTGEWGVSLRFDGEGTTLFRETTTRIRQRWVHRDDIPEEYQAMFYEEVNAKMRKEYVEREQRIYDAKVENFKFEQRQDRLPGELLKAFYVPDRRQKTPR